MFRKEVIIAVGTLIGLTACQKGVEFGLPSQTNEFQQAPYQIRNVDVVFVMDNSSGMEEHNLKLRNTIPTLVNAMLAQGLDLHIAVITSSMGGDNPNGGRFLGTPKYFTSQSPDLANQLSARLSQVGNNGSDLERGLDSLASVLSDRYLAGEGVGFLRDDALLSIISVSSEDDKSSLISGGVDAYMAELDRVKGGLFEDGSRKWVMNFIGVLSLSGSCVSTPGNPSGYKEPGIRWMTMAEDSGGIKESICATDLSVAASNIRRRTAQIVTDFHLKFIPNLATVRVTVNGVVVPQDLENGWGYIADRNVIRFYGSAVPAVDAHVTVDADPASAN